ncbi:hypothetical protein ACM26M_12095 [Kluyvera cryocrescens]|uniref:hypothetical protein n=1 Tax=Kluyvera cryocrescens TaxID=580 RepID=UPI0039F658F8
MYKLALATLAMATLTACNSSPSDQLVKIVSLRIPVVQNEKSSVPVAEMASLHQKNKQIIDNLTLNLKSEYLLDVKTAEIFDIHSQAHQVYQSLSRLDQMRMVNNFYLKEHNFTGLQRVNISLQPLTQG